MSPPSTPATLAVHPSPIHPPSPGDGAQRIGAPSVAFGAWAVLSRSTMERIVLDRLKGVRLEGRRACRVAYCEASSPTSARLVVSVAEDLVPSCSPSSVDAPSGLYELHVEQLASLAIRMVARNPGGQVWTAQSDTRILGTDGTTVASYRMYFAGSSGYATFALGDADLPPLELAPPLPPPMASESAWFRRGAELVVRVGCASIPSIVPGQIRVGEASVTDGTATVSEAQCERDVLSATIRFPAGHVVARPRWERTGDFVSLTGISVRPDAESCENRPLCLGRAAIAASVASAAVSRPVADGGWIGHPLVLRSEDATAVVNGDHDASFGYGTVGSTFGNGILELGMWVDVW